MCHWLSWLQSLEINRRKTSIGLSKKACKLQFELIISIKVKKHLIASLYISLQKTDAFSKFANWKYLISQKFNGTNYPIIPTAQSDFLNENIWVVFRCFAFHFNSAIRNLDSFYRIHWPSFSCFHDPPYMDWVHITAPITLTYCSWIVLTTLIPIKTLSFFASLPFRYVCVSECVGMRINK